MASARANCRAPSIPLISLVERFDWVTYLNEGTPTARSIAMIAITMRVSIRLKPRWGGRRSTVGMSRVSLSMGSILMKQTCLKLTAGAEID